MTEQAGDHRHRHAIHHRVTGMRVTQVMQPRVLDPGLPRPHRRSRRPRQRTPVQGHRGRARDPPRPAGRSDRGLRADQRQHHLVLGLHPRRQAPSSAGAKSRLSSGAMRMPSRRNASGRLFGQHSVVMTVLIPDQARSPQGMHGQAAGQVQPSRHRVFYCLQDTVVRHSCWLGC